MSLILFNSHSNHTWVLLLPFRDKLRLRLPQATQPISGRTWTQIEVCLIPQSVIISITQHCTVLFENG